MRDAPQGAERVPPAFILATPSAEPRVQRARLVHDAVQDDDPSARNTVVTKLGERQAVVRLAGHVASRRGFRQSVDASDLTVRDRPRPPVPNGADGIL
jgi:hypothetical protein